MTPGVTIYTVNRGHSDQMVRVSEGKQELDKKAVYKFYREGALKPPFPFPNKMLTLFDPKLATARSSKASALNRPTVTERGFVPA